MKKLLPQPADHVSFEAAQDVTGSLGCKCTLLGRAELLNHQHPQVLLLRVTFNLSSAQPAFMLGIALKWVQDLPLGLVELHEAA